MEKKHRIDFVMGIMMMFTAVVLDLIQGLLTLLVLLMPLSWVLTFFGVIGFTIWFFLEGAYSGKSAEKTALTSLASAIVEFIPGLNVVPAFTASTAINIVLSRIEDAKRNTAVTSPKRLQAKARLERMKASRAERANAAEQERAGAQEERHSAANDNEDEEEGERQAA